MTRSTLPGSTGGFCKSPRRNSRFFRPFFFAFAGLLGWFSLSRSRLVERIVLPVFAGASALLGALFLCQPFREPAEGVFWFLLKVSFFLFLYIWIRWTLPRFRYDTLMEFGWKRLVPVTLANLLLAAFVVAWRMS